MEDHDRHSDEVNGKGYRVCIALSERVKDELRIAIDESEASLGGKMLGAADKRQRR